MDYSNIGKYIHLIDNRNTDLAVNKLVGLTVDKKFIPSVANIIGTDLSRYKVIRKNQFACSLMQVSRDGKMPVAMFKDDVAIMSPAYPMFEVNNEEELTPEYLMMYLSRPEFDREAVFYAIGGVRGSLEWEDFLNMPIPVPPISEQRRIVSEYQTVERRIKNNEAMIKKLEETAQAIYHHTFVEGIDENNLPEGWRMGCLSDVATIIMGQSPDGDSLNENGDGEIFYQGRTDFGFRFPSVRIYTDAPTRFAEYKDVLMSVRAPVGDLNIAPFRCAIGRGISAIREKKGRNGYVFYLLKTKEHDLKVSDDAGTVFGSINKDELHSLPVIIPNDDVIDNFQHNISPIDNCIESYSRETSHLRTLLSLLTSKLS